MIREITAKALTNSKLHQCESNEVRIIADRRRRALNHVCGAIYDHGAIYEKFENYECCSEVVFLAENLFSAKNFKAKLGPDLGIKDATTFLLLLFNYFSWPLPDQIRFLIRQILVFSLNHVLVTTLWWAVLLFTY